jgi:hypothetical protein
MFFWAETQQPRLNISLLHYAHFPFVLRSLWQTNFVAGHTHATRITPSLATQNGGTAGAAATVCAHTHNDT